MTRAGNREWTGLAVLTLPALLASMDLSVLFMAAPWLTADLAPTGTQLLWIMDVYGFLMGGMFVDPGQRRTAIGIWTGAFTGGIAVGPVVGGLLLERFWWGSVFLINVPVMALLLLIGPALLPESRDARSAGFDPV